MRQVDLARPNKRNWPAAAWEQASAWAVSISRLPSRSWWVWPQTRRKHSGSKVVWVSQCGLAAGEHPCTGTVTKGECAHQDGGYLGRFVCFEL